MKNDYLNHVTVTVKFFRKEQWDWAVAFSWSSLPIIPTPRLAASDFLRYFDDNVLRQAAKVMTISQCGIVQGSSALYSHVLALQSPTFNTDTRSEIDTKVCHTEEYIDIYIYAICQI